MAPKINVIKTRDQIPQAPDGKKIAILSGVTNRELAAAIAGRRNVPEVWFLIKDERLFFFVDTKPNGNQP
jgi:hypothetical protein